MKFISGLITLFLRTWTTAGIAFKRLLTQRFLSLSAVIGLMIASGFILSVPLYADATYFRLLREELLANYDTELVNKPADYAPLAFTFQLRTTDTNPPQWRDVAALDTYLTTEALRDSKIPVQQVVRRFRTDSYPVYPVRNLNQTETQYILVRAKLVTITPLADTVQIIAGHAPAPFVASLDQSAPLEVLVNEEAAIKLGFQIGDMYSLRLADMDLPISISGLWRAVDPRASYWEVDTSNWLIVTEESYSGALSDKLTDELRNSNWVITASGSGLHAEDVTPIKENILAVEQHANALLPGTKLISSPLDALERYEKNAPTLTYLLFAFSVPILGLILAFIGLVAGLFVGQQRGEMAILRSRGASIFQVIEISLLQGIILGTVALAGGIGLGYWITYSIGRARSFLDFSATGGLRVSMTAQVLIYGLIGIGLILLIQVLIPTFSAAANTIVTYKQERARSFRTPGWQKLWLDVLLLIPAGYGLWQLQEEGKVALTGKEAVPNPLQNPLLLLVPALGIFAVALFTLRIVPPLMDFFSWSLKRTKSVGLLMAARYLARTPAFYSAPLVLLVLTLGLSAFTASLARTLDSQLEKQKYYQTGADLNVYELGTTVNDSNSTSPVYTFREVDDHLTLPGVEAATRVGRFKASVLSSGAVTEVTFLGVDRLTFPSAAYWQKDFAAQQLGSLMNVLATDPDAILVPNSFLQKQKLQIGDKLSMAIKTGVQGQSVPYEARIAGSFDLFPTWYPTNGPIIVGNLDEFFLRAGGEYPYEVWIKTKPNAEPESIVYTIRGYSILLDLQADQAKLVTNGLNTLVKNWSSSELNVQTEQRRPERQGLFGLLSVGFVASALLTVLGFLLYAMFSFRRRFIEMGMLRAVGLSIQQMIALLAAELAFLVLIGIGAGTALGVFASRLFVPFLQIGAKAAEQYPPFRIEIAWLSIVEIYVLFIILFIAALGVLTALLMRMKIFQAIKLGETS